jgi:UDP-glucose 4-epimerase
MPTVLVTGASGFIGGKLCARLKADGFRVIAIVGKNRADGPWDECFAVDIADATAVAALVEKIPGGCDTVFHLAGKAHALSEIGGDDSAYFRINADGTRNLLALARALGARRFVLASTVKAMGEGGFEPGDESAGCEPTTPYGKSKYEAELAVLAPDSGVPGVALRLSMVYGGKERGNMTRMVDAVRRHRFPPFPETGNRRSMVHVDDVVEALVLASSHPAAVGETFIVTDGKFYSTREIYRIILRALGRKEPAVTPPLWFFRFAAKIGDLLGRLAGRRMPLDTDSLSKLTDSAAYSNRKICEKLGFSPRYTLEDGVRGILAELGK